MNLHLHLHNLIQPITGTVSFKEMFECFSVVSVMSSSFITETTKSKKHPRDNTDSMVYPLTQLSKKTVLTVWFTPSLKLSKKTMLTVWFTPSLKLLRENYNRKLFLGTMPESNSRHEVAAASSQDSCSPHSSTS